MCLVVAITADLPLSFDVYLYSATNIAYITTQYVCLSVCHDVQATLLYYLSSPFLTNRCVCVCLSVCHDVQATLLYYLSSPFLTNRCLSVCLSVCHDVQVTLLYYLSSPFLTNRCVCVCLSVCHDVQATLLYYLSSPFKWQPHPKYKANSLPESQCRLGTRFESFIRG